MLHDAVVTTVMKHAVVENILVIFFIFAVFIWFVVVFSDIISSP